MRIKGRNISLNQLPGKLFKRFKAVSENRIQSIHAHEYLLRLSDRTNLNPKVKIGFIVQMPEIWEKEAPVFEAMMENELFEPYLIVVPKFDIVRSELCEYGDEKIYFEEKYPTSNIIYKDSNGFYSIKNYGFDYIFYQRPYNIYLPNELKPENVITFSKICYIPYGKETLRKSVQYNEDFFRYAYVVFLAGEEEKSFFNTFYAYRRWRNLYHLEWIGYPCFEHCYKKRVLINTKHILWTPRWSYDPNVGGSHFLEYRNMPIDIKRKFPELKITIRPHPMMWENFIKEGLMTETEIANYISELEHYGIKFDDERFFEDSIKDKSILITDISSIIPEFFLTERPIVYCPAMFSINSFYEKLLDVTYKAFTYQELISTLEKLINGNDYLFENRRSVIKKEFEFLDNATQNIVHYIENDYRSKRQ